MNNKSVLAVFPTGGGKSITFQVPALMSAENSKGLTIVISPLQSLMKDQVDNLEKSGITEAVTINGLLDPIERAKSFERIEDGSASILYISPESLRSRTIEKLILGRKIARFVIDEAHCFSSWGQDFRVDYLYIGDFIKLIQEKKNLEDGIPVSCFTATAKQKVIEDIRGYFSEKLALDLEVFTSKASRTNLQYKVFEKQNEDEKYLTARDLIEEKNCPTIIYVSRTRKAYLLAERLANDGFSSKPYHGKMDKQEKTKNQNDFLNGETQIMVATSAFGMGVDKKDVGLVIHFEISDSLENYVQEAESHGMNIIDGLFHLYHNYAIAYRSCEHYDKAAQMYALCVKLSREFDLPSRLEKSLFDLGYHLILVEDFETAAEVLDNYYAVLVNNNFSTDVPIRVIYGALLFANWYNDAFEKAIESMGLMIISCYN